VLVTTRVMASRLSYLYQHFPSGYPSLRSFVNDRHRFAFLAMSRTISALPRALQRCGALQRAQASEGALVKRVEARLRWH
jgi:hypothetical protein